MTHSMPFSNRMPGRKAFALLLIISFVSFCASAEAGRKFSDEVFECWRTHSVRFNGTIVDAAVATPELSTLVGAVTSAGLVDALNAPAPKTVFAPTNDAFAAIPPDQLNQILADPSGLLTDVLTYHVVPKRINPKRAFRTRSRSTLSKQNIFYGLNHRGAFVNNSKIDCRGVYTDNGVVWIIDSVLLPQFLQH